MTSPTLYQWIEKEKQKPPSQIKTLCLYSSSTSLLVNQLIFHTISSAVLLYPSPPLKLAWYHHSKSMTHLIKRLPLFLLAKAPRTCNRRAGLTRQPQSFSVPRTLTFSLTLGRSWFSWAKGRECLEILVSGSCIQQYWFKWVWGFLETLSLM